jgi:hypothetical protein
VRGRKLGLVSTDKICCVAVYVDAGARGPER